MLLSALLYVGEHWHSSFRVAARHSVLHPVAGLYSSAHRGDEIDAEDMPSQAMAKDNGRSTDGKYQGVSDN